MLFDLRKLTCERVHNALHKKVTSTLNTTFFKASGLYIFMYKHRHNNRITEINDLHLFQMIKKNLVSPFDEMAKKMEFYSKTMILSLT